MTIGVPGGTRRKSRVKPMWRKTDSNTPRNNRETRMETYDR